MDANQLANGIGVNQCWSFSPAIDLLADVNFASTTADTDTDTGNDYNILLAHTSDVSHVVKTLAHLSSHPSFSQSNVTVHFHILEASIEAIGRSILLLPLILDESAEMSDDRAVETFLEVHHNTMIQSRTQTLLASLATEAICATTAAMSEDSDRYNDNHSDEIISRQSFASLKHASIDALNDYLSFVISNSTTATFNVTALHTARATSYYSTRYDSRMNLIDWDYNMRIKLIASIIHIYHYRRWRMTGQGYEVRDCQYDRSNPTMASYRQATLRGRSVELRGLWHDIVVSPLVAYGVDIDTAAANHAQFYETANDQHTKTSQHIEEANLALWRQNYTESKQQMKKRFQIHFHHGSLAALAGKSKWKKKFHLIYLAALHSQELDDLSALIDDTHSQHGLLVDSLYYYPLTEREKLAFVDKTRASCLSLDWAERRATVAAVQGTSKNVEAAARCGARFLSFQRSSSSAHRSSHV